MTPQSSPGDPGRVPEALGRLLAYALDRGLITPADHVSARNRILDVLHQSEYDPILESDRPLATGETIDDLLRPLLDSAVDSGRVPVDTPAARDLLDTAIMGTFVDRPGEVALQFWSTYVTDPGAATDAFHRQNIDVNAIRRSRCERNITWAYPSRYGVIDMAINLSEAQPDPQEATGPAHRRPPTYPKCPLCKESEGYGGRADFPARQNVRLIPMEITGEAWYMGFTQYQHFPQEAVFPNGDHRPMLIDRAGLERLLELLDVLPHYVVGSDADLPGLGRSQLAHDHFRGGRFEFPLQRARVLHRITDSRLGVDLEIVDWPLTVLRLVGEDPGPLLELADQIVSGWRQYSDDSLGVLAATDGTPHNTVTPVCRRLGDLTQLHLVLRNNRTSDEQPDGVFGPRAGIHAVNRMGVGLVEAMGLAVLPSRLAADCETLTDCLMTDQELPDRVAGYQPMAEPLRLLSPFTNRQAAEDVVQAAIAESFVAGLEHCAVFGPGEAGLPGVTRFVESLG
jgi:UDPglucose--hexose-1-phosphate uridylyltransferase